MKQPRATVTYLYCLVADSSAPSLSGAPRGLAGTGPLRLLAVAPSLDAGGAERRDTPARRRGGTSIPQGRWLVVADAPVDRYGAQAIERGLRDLDWVGACAAAHEAVMEHFASRTTTVPMKLFTLFTSDARAVAHVQGLARSVEGVIARIAGRQEWGLRLRLDERRATQGRGEPKTGVAGRGASGTAFLLGKKAARDARRTLLADARAEADTLFERLAKVADDARRRPPVTVEGVRLLLDAAFLLPTDRASGFTTLARTAADRLASLGIDVTLTGPWPAYNFVGTAS